MSVFEITIQHKDEDDWPVVVRHQPGAQALAQWSRGRLDLDLARLEALRPTDKEYGIMLGQVLLQEEIRDAFVRVLTGTSGEDEPLRVLLIVEADALRDLHWEQLCAPLERGWDCLLLNQGTLFSFYLPSQIERRFPPHRPPRPAGPDPGGRPGGAGGRTRSGSARPVTAPDGISPWTRGICTSRARRIARRASNGRRGGSWPVEAIQAFAFRHPTLHLASHASKTIIGR